MLGRETCGLSANLVHARPSTCGCRCDNYATQQPVATGDSTRVAPVTPNHGAPIETTTPSSTASLPPSSPSLPPSSTVVPTLVDGGGPTPPDDTAVNQRDRGNSTLTPMDQGTSEADRKTTQQIRQAVVDDKTLSFTAKNVKIITKDGKVTLRGPVKNSAEKATIDSIARKVAGAQVDDQLEVAK